MSAIALILWWKTASWWMMKAVETLLAIHEAQVLSYLKLSGMRVGLLINFNVVHLRDGIRRLVNGLK